MIAHLAYTGISVNILNWTSTVNERPKQTFVQFTMVNGTLSFEMKINPLKTESKAL